MLFPLPEHGFVQSHLLCWDGDASQQFKQITSVEEAEYIVRTFVAQTDPAVRIDMVHHEGNIVLGVLPDIRPLWDEVANELMVSFRRTLLVGSLRITVENPGSSETVRSELNMCRIRELASVVSKAEPEDAGKTVMA